MRVSPQVLGILIGGILPAVSYGLVGVLTKAGSKWGLSAGPFLLVVGVAIVLASIPFFLLVPERAFSMRSALWSFAVGLVWAAGTGCLAIGIVRYGMPVGKLVPIHALSTLVAVFLSLWLLREWREVNAFQLLLGSFFVVAGAILVARS